MSKKDITCREDIVALIDTFYDRVRKNEVIGYIFNDIARVDWDHHLPIMYSFWSDLLLGEHRYFGNPMQKHIALSKHAPLTETEFSEWLRLFSGTVDELFEGEMANEAKTRASNIARMMQLKISSARPEAE